MIKVISIIMLTILFVGCKNSAEKEYEKRAEEIRQDSAKKMLHLDRVQKLVNSGMSIAEADSTVTAIEADTTIKP